MSDPFVAEIRMFPFNFPPKGWAFCNGQILPISQNTALFSLLGTYFGGNGTSNFALPNLQGRAPMHTGRSQGPGLSPHSLGEQAGVETETLLMSEMPQHNHSLNTYNDIGEDRLVGPTEALSQSTGGLLYAPSAPNTPMSPAALPVAGNNLPHNNMQPYLTVNFCIAMQGIYPSRS